MLRINDRFSVYRDARNWILCDTHYTMCTRGDNKGKMLPRVRESYFGSLELLCDHCVDRSLDPTGGFAEMREAIQFVHRDLKTHIRNQGLQTRRLLKESM